MKMDVSNFTEEDLLMMEALFEDDGDASSSGSSDSEAELLALSESDFQHLCLDAPFFQLKEEPRPEPAAKEEESDDLFLPVSAFRSFGPQWRPVSKLPFIPGVGKPTSTPPRCVAEPRTDPVAKEESEDLYLPVSAFDSFGPQWKPVSQLPFMPGVGLKPSCTSPRDVTQVEAAIRGAKTTKTRKRRRASGEPNARSKVAMKRARQKGQFVQSQYIFVSITDLM